MAEISVDREKLEYGLQKGIFHSDTMYGGFETPHILRYAPCGMVSSAIYEYLAAHGIPAAQRISSPGLSFDPKMQHVVPTVEADDNPLVIDASYSQFLQYGGMNVRYEELTGESVLPEDKIIMFRFSAHKLFISWISNVVWRFQAKNTQPVDDYGIIHGKGPLTDAALSEIRAAYSKIWSPAGLQPHTPIPRVQNDGLQVARHIPAGAISIS